MSTAPDTQQIWKDMGDERRLQAGEAFYSDSALKEFHRAADTFIARIKNFRPQFVKKLPATKRASYLTHMPISQELMGQLIISYHFAHQRPMMAAFLNALGIANDNGLIQDTANTAPPTPEALTQAIETVKANFPKNDLAIYLATICAHSPETWGALQPLLESFQPARP